MPAGHRQRVAAERAGLIDRAGGADHFHQLVAGRVGADRQAAADDFAQAGDVRLDVIAHLRAAPGDAEAGHHFVEQQQRAVLVAQLAQALQISGGGQDHAHVSRDRLDDEAGDLVGVFLEDCFGLFEVVVVRRRRCWR